MGDENKSQWSTESRISKLEEWRQHHPDVHRLEEVARNIAKAEVDRRLDSMNEMRKQIDAERGTYVLREYYEREHSSLKADLGEVRLSQGGLQSEKGVIERVLLPLILGAIMFVIGHFAWK